MINHVKVGAKIRDSDTLVIAVGIKKAVHSELMLMATNSHLVHETKTFKEKFDNDFFV